MDNYVLADFGGEYSANPADYWYLADSERMSYTLVKKRHPWRTKSGHTVLAPRVIRDQPSMRDLRRLAAVTR